MYHISLVGSEHGSRDFENVPCSAHVPHIRFRTCSEHPGLLFSVRKKPLRDANGRQKDSNIRNVLFSRIVYTFRVRNIEFSKSSFISTISMHPKIQNRIIEAYLISNLRNMFRTCSAQFQLEQCSMPTKQKSVQLYLPCPRARTPQVTSSSRFPAPVAMMSSCRRWMRPMRNEPSQCIALICI